MIKRVVLVVMDSVGAGFMPDASKYNDGDTNTLGNIYKKRGSLDLPNLCLLGLGKVVDIGCHIEDVTGCYGRMKEVSPGKDTTTGHWEMAGVHLDYMFPVYPKGFPKQIVREFEKKSGVKTLGNYPCSGTVIIEELGEEHLRTGYPIIYTSADSVFQIAAHQEVVTLEKLYQYCRIARNILKGAHSVARVIARPFFGKPGDFKRNEAARKDFSLIPPEKTLLDVLKDENCFVVGIGKIGDIFAHQGLTEEVHSDNNMDGIDKTIDKINEYRGHRGLFFTNLVEFDSVYGHRRNAEGYARALEELDQRIPEIMEILTDDELLILTADHGCDPTHTVHTDHTREYVPVLVFGKAIRKNVDLGIRKTFSDCGQTIADFLGVERLNQGQSFRKELSWT